MALSFPVVWSDAQRLHAPETGVWLGVAIAADEVPARADCIRGVLEEAGAIVVAAEAHDDETLLAVHDAGLIEFLRSAWSEWQAEGYRDDPGQADVVCYIFPTTAGLLSGLEPRCARGASRVGLLDVDAHHGNGAQAIFPGARRRPHRVRARRPGRGLVPALPRVPGRKRAVEPERHAPVALGVDAGTDDPNSPLAVTEDGFREAGRRLGALALPTVVVQEGGYVLDTVGLLVLAALEGIDETR